MAIQVQIRRGTTSENNAFTGASGEITCDTEAHTLRIHDGTTAGGFVVDQSDNVVHKAGNKNEEINGTKTFTANPYIKKNSPYLIFTNTDINLPNPTANNIPTYSSITYVDSTGKELGFCRHTYKTINNINYSQIELIAIDPDPTHYNNRIVSTNNIIYIQAGDDDTNRVRRWKQENTTTIFYTPYTGTTSDPIRQPIVGSNIYSDITCQTTIDTIAQIGGTRVNTALTLEAKGGTERYAYLNFNPPANSSTSSTHLATVGWCNDYQLSTNLVHRDSAETITGNKTFSGTNTFSGSNTFSSSVSLGSSATATKPSSATDNSTKIPTTSWVYQNHGFVIADWYSGANFYRKYSNNWIEQGGVVTGANFWVGFHIKMNPGTILVTNFSQYAGERVIELYVSDATTTGFTIINRNISQMHYWFAAGFAA